MKIMGLFLIGLLIGGCRLAAQENARPIEVTVKGSFNYGPIDGFMQTPAGGAPGSSSTRRPAFKELGINDVIFYDTRLDVRWKDLTMFGGYEFVRLDGSAHLSDPLVSRSATFSSGDSVRTDDQFDWYRAGIGWNFKLLDRKLDLIPKAEFALFDFQYALSSASTAVSRSYIKAAPRLGIETRYRLNRGISFDFEGAAALPLSNTPQIASVGGTANFPSPARKPPRTPWPSHRHRNAMDRLQGQPDIAQPCPRGYRPLHQRWRNPVLLSKTHFRADFTLFRPPKFFGLLEGPPGRCPTLSAIMESKTMKTKEPTLQRRPRTRIRPVSSLGSGLFIRDLSNCLGDNFSDLFIRLGAMFQTADGTADAGVVNAANVFTQLFQFQAAAFAAQIHGQVASPIRVRAKRGVASVHYAIWPRQLPRVCGRFLSCCSRSVKRRTALLTLT